MDADDRSVEELLKMAEKWANEHSSGEKRGYHRIEPSDAQALINKGFVNIWPIWHVLVQLKDEALSHAIGAVWVPHALLDGKQDPDELMDENGQYECVLSSRIWFDEDKLMTDDTQLIYSAISIVVLMCRTLDTGFGSWLKQQMMKEDRDDPDSD